jgi:benzil reductase ((S)-benzoin forming)
MSSNIRDHIDDSATQRLKKGSNGKNKISPRRTLLTMQPTLSVAAATLNNSKMEKKKNQKARRWTWKKPPDKPSRPLSGYNLFFCDMRKDVLQDQKTSGGFSNLARNIAEKWKAAPEDIKAMYQAKADIEKEKYKISLANWQKEQLNKATNEKSDLKMMGTTDSTNSAASDNNDISRSDRNSVTGPGSLPPERVVSQYDILENFPAVIMDQPVHDFQRGIAVVTEGKSGVGKALALKIASFQMVDIVLSISRSISYQDVLASPKIQSIAADIGTEEGRQVITEHVRALCNAVPRKRQLRFLIHCATTADPVKSAFDIQPDELRRAMATNCEAPFFLTTALYPYMISEDSIGGVAGRVLHVSSGHTNSAQGTSTSDMASAAFFQSYQSLEREIRFSGGGKVVLGSFKTGVADIQTQGADRLEEAMLMVDLFKNMKGDGEDDTSPTVPGRPTLAGVFDTLDNAANFAEYLLLGTTDEEFSNDGVPNEYGIRKTTNNPASKRGRHRYSISHPSNSILATVRQLPTHKPMQAYQMAYSFVPNATEKKSFRKEIGEV